MGQAVHPKMTAVPQRSMTRLAFAWLLLCAMLFGLNATALGVQAGAGNGFVSQAEQLFFASHADNIRLINDTRPTSPTTDGLPELLEQALIAALILTAPAHRASFPHAVQHASLPAAAYYLRPSPRAPPAV